MPQLNLQGESGRSQQCIKVYFVAQENNTATSKVEVLKSRAHIKSSVRWRAATPRFRTLSRPFWSFKWRIRRSTTSGLLESRFLTTCRIRWSLIQWQSCTPGFITDIWELLRYVLHIMLCSLLNIPNAAKSRSESFRICHSWEALFYSRITGELPYLIRATIKFLKSQSKAAFSAPMRLRPSQRSFQKSGIPCLLITVQTLAGRLLNFSQTTAFHTHTQTATPFGRPF